MSRGIDPATITALASDSFNFVTLIRLDFETPILITNWSRDVTVDDDTFLSSPHFLESGSPTESAQLRVNSINLILSGVEQSYVSVFLSQAYMGKRVRIWKAVLDDSDELIGEKILTFDGRITDFGIADSETDSQVEIQIASHWSDFQKVNGRKTNQNSQHQYFSGDLGFEFAANSVKDLKWGRP